MKDSERSAFLPGQIERENWGGLFTDVDLWRPAVQQILLESGFAEGKVIEAGYPGSCAVFIVDRANVVKIYPPIFAADFEREVLVYDAIQDRLPLIPRVLAHGVYQDRIDWPFIILSFCPGEPIREVSHLFLPEDKERIGEQLGRLIRSLHEGAVPQGLSLAWNDWRDFLLDNRARTGKHLSQERPFSEQVIGEIEQFLAAMEPVWLTERPLCLINADLTQDHLLLVEDEKGWRVSAVIDWADAEIGVPGYEWIPLWYGLCQQDELLFHSILGAYDPGQKTDPAFGDQLLAYTFLHRFGGEIVSYILNERGNPKIEKFADLRAVLLPNRGN